MKVINPLKLKKWWVFSTCDFVYLFVWFGGFYHSLSLSGALECKPLKNCTGKLEVTCFCSNLSETGEAWETVTTSNIAFLHPGSPLCLSSSCSAHQIIVSQLSTSVLFMLCFLLAFFSPTLDLFKALIYSSVPSFGATLTGSSTHPFLLMRGISQFVWKFNLKTFNTYPTTSV